MVMARGRSMDSRNVREGDDPSPAVRVDELDPEPSQQGVEHLERVALMEPVRVPGLRVLVDAEDVEASIAVPSGCSASAAEQVDQDRVCIWDRQSDLQSG